MMGDQGSVAVGTSSAWRAAGALLVNTAPLLAVVAIFLLVRAIGDDLPPPLRAGASELSRGDAFNPLLRVLIALAAVLALAALLRPLMLRLGQPPVIGEVIAGIALGPSLLGTEWSGLILPADVAPFMRIIADIGVVLYMFIVGLELNLGALRHRAPTLIAISQMGIAVPFALGTVLALFLYPTLSTSSASFTTFAIFMGVAMSITAFPVLARILGDRGMQGSELGALALGCAAVGDVAAWCLLAFAVSVAQSELGGGISTLGGVIVYGAAMLIVARPMLVKLNARWAHGPLPPIGITLVFLGVVVSALATEAIGIHAIFGAFLLGALIPHDGSIAKVFIKHLKPLVIALLLPAFFAYAGMQTRIDLLNSAELWLIGGLIIAVAMFGKIGGTYLAARLRGLTARDSAALGALMNTRGLVELIVLNVGLSYSVISLNLFSMMTIMAIVTTLATTPLLRLILGPAPAPRPSTPGLD